VKGADTAPGRKPITDEIDKRPKMTANPTHAQVPRSSAIPNADLAVAYRPQKTATAKCRAKIRPGLIVSVSLSSML
jgi:hypothetical protein